LFLSDFYNIEDMEKSADKIIDAFNEPFNIGKIKIKIAGSMGVSVYPDDAISQSDLVKFADTAMYDSKKNAEIKYQFYYRMENKK